MSWPSLTQTENLTGKLFKWALTYTTNGVASNAKSVATSPTVSTAGHGPGDTQPPPWASKMLHRLQQIESHLDNQNKKWQTVESTLQAQNTRMSNMEIQIKELNRHKHNMNNIDVKVNLLGDEVSFMSFKISEYDETINTYSDMFDDSK